MPGSETASPTAKGLSLSNLTDPKSPSPQAELNVLLVACTPQQASLLASKLAGLGGRVVAGHGAQLDAWVPVSAIPALARLPELRMAGRHFIPHPHAIEGEERGLMKAAFAHTNGVLGSNVKVAVIDVGFSGLAAAQAAGELPPSLETVDFTGSGLTQGSAHGTGVAEIIHETAPGAGLALLKIANSVHLGLAKDWCVANGVRVINHSVGWFNTGFGSGDGAICAIASNAAAEGILWVNSAGNEAQSHWQGNFNGSAATYHLFSPASTFHEIGRYEVGGTVALYLSWNEGWGSAISDFDLFLYWWNGSAWKPVDYSVDNQASFPFPVESVEHRVTNAGYFAFRIGHYAGPTARSLQVFASSPLQFPVAARSLPEPANSAQVLAVGAVKAALWQAGPVEPFSSRGPTQDGRTKPDLVGADGVTNFSYGSFYGTSGAAPGVAGAAALALSEYPSFTLSELRQHLAQTASVSGLSGNTNDFGAGRASVQLLPSAIQSIVARSAPYSAEAPAFQWSSRVRNRIPLSPWIVVSNRETAASARMPLAGSNGLWVTNARLGQSLCARLLVSNAWGSVATPWSPSVTFDDTPPSAPGLPQISAAEGGVMDAFKPWNWADSVDTESGVAAYVLQFSRDASFSELIHSNVFSPYAARVGSGLAHGSRVHARVACVNQAGLASPWSPTAGPFTVDGLLPSTQIEAETNRLHCKPTTVTLTPNKPDAVIWYGIARESSAWIPMTNRYRSPITLAENATLRFAASDALGRCEAPRQASFRFVAEPKGDFAIYQNFIRPGYGALRFVAKEPGLYRLDVCDALGRKVGTLGTRRVAESDIWEWDGHIEGRGLSSRQYYLRVERDGTVVWHPFRIH